MEIKCTATTPFDATKLLFLTVVVQYLVCLMDILFFHFCSATFEMPMLSGGLVKWLVSLTRSRVNSAGGQHGRQSPWALVHSTAVCGLNSRCY